LQSQARNLKSQYQSLTRNLKCFSQNLKSVSNPEHKHYNAFRSPKRHDDKWHKIQI